MRSKAGIANPASPIAAQATAPATYHERTPSSSASGTASSRPSGAVMSARLPISVKTRPYYSILLE